MTPAVTAFLGLLQDDGVTDRRVLDAMARVPRERFVEPEFAPRAYENLPLPIACDQTISQPSVVGLMTQELAVESRMKVLEVGAGSGYQTAILAGLCRRVYALERHAPLAAKARERLESLGISNVILAHGDGSEGWPRHAPFDRILVAAAAEDPPRPLLDQLRVGGIMILPIGEEGTLQQLIKVTRGETEFTYEELSPVRFVPLLHGFG